MADYISREAAIEAFENADTDVLEDYGDGACDWGFGMKNIQEVLNSVPTADVEPVRRWIPCSERLPEVGTECNVVWVNHDPEPYYAEIKDVPGVAAAIYYKGKWYWWSSTCEDVLAEYGKNDFDKVDDCIEITHWMPLPEPPEEGGHENAAD